MGIVCTKCKEEKDPEDFGTNSRKVNGRNSACRECYRALCKDWHQRNKEGRAAYDKERHEQDPFKKHEWYRKWKDANPEKVKQNHHKRRVLEQESDITEEFLRELLVSSTCPLCGILFIEESNHPAQRHLDHIIPVGIGGTHSKDNVRIICRTCNLSRPKDGSDLISEEKETLEYCAASAHSKAGVQSDDSSDWISV